MTSVAVLVPVLGRPHRADPVARSIRESEPRATPLFLCSPEDDAEIAECRRVAWTLVMKWEAGHGDYARKMNFGYLHARNLGFEWVFLGADDLVFHPGWFDACLRAHDSGDFCVVGTNDLGNTRVVRGHHSTHTLVHTDYLDCGTADEDGLILHEGYGHQFVDDEFIQTAMGRHTYVHARDAQVEHLHPNWGKGGDDATYRKGAASFEADRLLYEDRQPLWMPDVTRARPRRR